MRLTVLLNAGGSRMCFLSLGWYNLPGQYNITPGFRLFSNLCLRTHSFSNFLKARRPNAGTPKQQDFATQKEH